MEEKTGRAYSFAYWLLYLGFTAAPILAGVDKFLYILGNWSAYLAPQIREILPISVDAFMKTVGVVEIFAGLLVWFRPKLGGYIVSGWLAAIIINIILSGEYYDVALRDFGLALGALALAKLSTSECRFKYGREARAAV
ncbi:MAG: hypothetical protein PHI60_06485 [Candidatus Omnitrophica bacterium]|nr:hypothetical protein [Candidatus Omnitrophota bacterium]